MKKRSKAGGKPIKGQRRKTPVPKRRRAPKAVSPPVPEETEVARLRRERNEALEQQTATSEVLQAISSSTGDLEPVFDTILEKAVRYCDAHFGTLFLYEKDQASLVAAHNMPTGFSDAHRRSPGAVPGGPVETAMRTRRTVHIPDLAATQSYRERHPRAVDAVELGSVRTTVAVPLLKDNEPIGVIAIHRPEVRPFTDKQIDLLANFAAQAVIAIENARLLNELRHSLEQQTATADVLKVISSSLGSLEPVFIALLSNATRLCGASYGNLWLCEGDAFRSVALVGELPPSYVERWGTGAVFRPGADVPLAKATRTKQPYQIPDIRASKPYREGNPLALSGVDEAGILAVLAVPLLKEGDVVGAILIYSKEARPFTEKQVELLENFAAQAVIAIENARLLNELRQRTTDLTEALEQQTATSEVLQVISGSTGDLEPIFRTMLEKAVRYCEAKFGTLYLRQGDQLSLVAALNVPPGFAEARGSSPTEHAPGGPLDAVMRTKRTVHTPDLAAIQSYAERHPRVVEAVELGGIRTVVTVPMLKDDDLVGVIAVHRREVRPFTDKQIDLVKNFAAQAVIAIENARLLNELREALDQQTATSEVLRVISSSPGDLEVVFRTMLENATCICEAKFGTLDLYEGGGLRLAAAHDVPPVFTEVRGEGPFQPAPGGILDTAMKTRRTVHIHDLATTDAYTQRHPRMVDAVEVAGIRTAVGVPMLKGEELVGIIAIFRQEVRPFTEKQIELFTNFANQAVIAIENARLLNELRQRTADLTASTTDLTEALEQQTATSEVLQVISSSPGDLEPVFATMLENATRICEAKFGVMQVLEGDGLRAVSFHDVPAAYAEAMRRDPVFRPVAGHPLDRVASTKQVVHIPDVRAEQRLRGWIVELAGARTLLCVPMLKDNTFVGVISIYRQEVRSFTDKQIALVQNFAAQAVIATENARLLNELRQRTTDLTDALEQQTATSEVLQAISSFPGDLQPVFAAMLENAVRICDATFGNIFRWDGDAFNMMASHKTPAAFAKTRQLSPIRPTPTTLFGRLVATKSPVHTADLAAEKHYFAERRPSYVEAVELGGIRAFLVVPMLKDDELIGAIGLFRHEVRPFTDKQIELVKNFAAQAVIAIENARLLEELRERTDQLAAQSRELATLNEQLERRVTDQVDEIERMSRLRRFLPPQVADLIVASGSEKQLESHRREITALFCDLRGFTGFTESADAEDVMALLRDYHAAIGEIIIKYNGTLERYAGDGVMVVFNDPVPVENPPLQAVLMALEVRDAIGALTEKWRRWGHDIGFGIGIAHGFATLGTIGFEGRFDYAAIGTVSNVASRLCDEARPGQILISPRVLTKVENAVRVEPVGEFELKGIRRPLAAYNVLAIQSSDA